MSGRKRHPTHGYDHSCMGPGKHGMKYGVRDDGTGKDGDHDEDDEAITEDKEHGSKKPKSKR